MRSRRCETRWMIWVAVAATMSATCMWSETALQERSFSASKPEVESALRTLQAGAGGRLPTVDGFIALPNQALQNQPLDRFQRPHYTYSIQVIAKVPTGSTVRVLARITAWYADKDSTKSGYRELVSNGRLESDLFERLEDALVQKSVMPTTQAEVREAPRKASPVATKPNGASNGAIDTLFKTPRAGTAGVLPRSAAESSATKSETRTSAKYAQELRQQASDLEEILHNQSQPTDLAVVKQSRTPVFERPSEDAPVLFLAEAEDEFQVLNTSAEWVHVQISGLSRGWIRGPKLELPSAQRRATAPSAAADGEPTSGARKSEDRTSADPAFRLARQEVNTFPGTWAPLRGKFVRILWLSPSDPANPAAGPKWEIARSMFERAVARIAAVEASPSPSATPAVEGVVLIFDSPDGGMAAATLTSLQEWQAGRLSEDAFRAQCSLDPPDAF